MPKKGYHLVNYAVVVGDTHYFHSKEDARRFAKGQRKRGHSARVRNLHR